MKIKKNHL